MRLGDAVERYSRRLACGCRETSSVRVRPRYWRAFANQLVPELTDEPAWPTLRAHLLLLAGDGADPHQRLRAACDAKELDAALMIEPPCWTGVWMTPACSAVEKVRCRGCPAFPNASPPNPHGGHTWRPDHDLVAQLADQVRLNVGGEKPAWARPAAHTRAGGLDEPAELGVSNWVLVHPEIADDLMDWAFFREEVPAPHPKLPTGHKHHSLRRRFHDVCPPSDTSPKDPFCPRLLHSAGPGTQRRPGSSANETLSTGSYRRIATTAGLRSGAAKTQNPERTREWALLDDLGHHPVVGVQAITEPNFVEFGLLAADELDPAWRVG